MKNKKLPQPNLIQQDFELDHRMDATYLTDRYKNSKAIIDQLCETSTSVQTYEFLGELFFTLTINEAQQDPPSDQWVRKMKNIRYEIYQLYELARAAKATRVKD